MKKENFIKSSFNVLMISLISCERVIIEAPNNQGPDDDTRLEARAISTFIPTDDYWTDERLICYDDPKDEAVNESYGTGEFYTFKFNSTTIPREGQSRHLLQHQIHPHRPTRPSLMPLPHRLRFHLEPRHHES